MWCDDLPLDTSWTTLWSGYIRCPDCSGIRTFNNPCPACGANLSETVEQQIVLDDGRKYSVRSAFMGAETRYEDYIYLQLLEREWNRMLRDSASKGHMPFAESVSTGASIVLLFWSYFETRIERLLRDGLQHVPPRFLEDALKRYSFIGARLTTFYQIAFESTYASDLASLGYSDVSDHLARIQARRNTFVHGSPQSIDDALVTSVVEMLKREHEAWIAVYNHRVVPPKV